MSREGKSSVKMIYNLFSRNYLNLAVRLLTFVFLVSFTFIVTGCTNTNQNVIYQLNTIGSNCFFKVCWTSNPFNGFSNEPAIRPIQVIELDEKNDLFTIPFSTAVNITYDGKWLGKYQYIEEQDQFVVTKKDEKIEYKVQKIGPMLILQNENETLELRPIRVKLSVSAIWGVLLIGTLLPLVGAFFLRRLIFNPIAEILSKNSWSMLMLSSILVGVACLFSSMMYTDLIRYDYELN